MTAFRATFSDFRIIKGRKVASICFEVPLEAADAALAVLGGVPRPDQEQWVAIARITEEAASKPPQPAQEPTKERRKFADLPYYQQAAMRCQEQAFRRFLEDVAPATWEDHKDAAAVVRRICGVESRSQIVAGSKAGDTWEQLSEHFDGWMKCIA